MVRVVLMGFLWVGHHRHPVAHGIAGQELQDGLPAPAPDPFI